MSLQVGLLWYDAGPSLAAKLREAAARYRVKYGTEPDTCCVTPAAAQGVGDIDGIKIIASARMRPGYLWLGRDGGEDTA